MKTTHTALFAHSLEICHLQPLRTSGSSRSVGPSSEACVMQMKRGTVFAAIGLIMLSGKQTNFSCIALK